MPVSVVDVRFYAETTFIHIHLFLYLLKLGFSRIRELLRGFKTDFDV